MSIYTDAQEIIHSALEPACPTRRCAGPWRGKSWAPARLFSRPGQGRLADGPLCRGAAGPQAGTGRGGHQAWTQPG